MKDLHAIVQTALGESKKDASEAKAKLMSELGFDELNTEYFLALYSSHKSCASSNVKEKLQIHEPGKKISDALAAYPTAIAPTDMMKHLPYVKYEELQGNMSRYSTRARDTMLWVKKMQAGTGSSMTRSSYLARIRKLPLEKVVIGAKGTDLYIDEQAGISLAESQILQAITDAQRGLFAEIALHDIVSSETEASLESIWNKPSAVDSSKTYDELVRALPAIQRFGRSHQSYIPTIDERGAISVKRLAPGGHALFAVGALRAAYIERLRPRPRNATTPIVAVIGNGEDLSSTPDQAMVGWMVEHHVPIVMVTTEKTENDLKGGQIALVKKSDGRVHVTIVEQAQAKESGQQALFEELGLRPHDGMAFFNTNMALFNYSALVPKIEKLVSDIGERKFLEVITPDLILNKKSQRDDDGVTRIYIQMEGAIGSSLLRLDRYWRERYDEPLVHFINVARKDRTSFFSPIKTAFDFFMQFHSDRFIFDRETYRLVNKRPGVLPAVNLNDQASGGKHWADVENVLTAFKGTSILELESLDVNGIVSLQGAVLRGKVKAGPDAGIKAVS